MTGIGPQARPHEEPMAETPRPDTTLIRVLNLFLRYRTTMWSVPIGLAAIVVVLGTLPPTMYTANAAFIPEAPTSTRSALSGLASQFGLAINPDEPGQSPAFYADLLTSRELLEAVAESTYRVTTPEGPRSATLIELLGIRVNSPALALNVAVRRLQKVTMVGRARETGVVTVAVRAPWPELAEQIVQRMLSLLNEFNLERRQSRAKQERRFLETRQKEAQDSLAAAEDRLRSFLQRNVEYLGSVELRFEQDRIARDVALRQALFTSLSQAYDQARVDEVRDTPVVTVIEHPELPVRPDPRHRLQNGLVAMLFGLLVAGGVVLLRDYMARTRSLAAPEVAELDTLRGAAAADVRRGWDRLRTLARLPLRKRRSAGP